VQKTRAGGKKRKKYTNKNALLGRIPRAETAGRWVKKPKEHSNKNSTSTDRETGRGKNKNKWEKKIKPAQKEEE
jgi:hypothetical protein